MLITAKHHTLPSVILVSTKNLTLQGVPRISSNTVQFSPETVKSGGGIDKEKLRQTIAGMRKSHLEIGNKFQLLTLQVVLKSLIFAIAITIHLKE